MAVAAEQGWGRCCHVTQPRRALCATLHSLSGEGAVLQQGLVWSPGGSPLGVKKWGEG